MNLTRGIKQYKILTKSRQTKKSVIAREAKKTNAGLHRFRIAESYKSLFKTVGQKLIDNEIEAVKRSAGTLLPAAKTISQKATNEWIKWLDGFYRDYGLEIQKYMMPAIHSLAEAIQEVAATEVNSYIGITPELENFLYDYAVAFNTRYINASKGQLKELVMEAIDNPLESVEIRLGEWEQTRADKISMNETVQLSNAVAKWTFASAGIVRLQWVALGSESCPLCQQLDGKIVGIDENFLNADAELQGEGATNFSIDRPTSHPPLHQGCVCQIVAI